VHTSGEFLENSEAYEASGVEVDNLL
jgi:hypothetical protein